MAEPCERPWGRYTVLSEEPQLKIKRLVVKPGGELSLQRHWHRCEHWVVLAVVATVVRDKEKFILDVYESTYIPTRTIHRLSNFGSYPLEIIEVQTGEYLGEDDIERYEDAYGRV